MTDDAELAATLRSLRMHGQGADRYDNTRIGTASRLDTIQAAVLIEKLKIFTDEIDARNRVAQRYKDGLGDVAVVPRIPDGMTSVWAQYTIRLKPGQREQACARAQGQGHPNRDLLPQTGAPPGGLPQFPSRGWRFAGQRRAGCGGDQPPDASLSG